MERGFVFLPLMIILTSFVSAALSINDLSDFAGVDTETLVLTAVFLIVFTLIYLPLNKVLGSRYKQSKAAAFLISICSAFLIIYYGIYQSNINVENFLIGDIGVSEGLLWILVPIILIAGLIFLMFKLKKKLLLLLGLFFILLSLTNLVFQKTFFRWLGIGLIAIWVVWWLVKVFWSRRKKKLLDNPLPAGRDRSREAENLNREINNLRREIYDLQRQLQQNPGDKKLREKIDILKSKLSEIDQQKQKAEHQVEESKEQLESTKQLRRNVYDLKQKYMAYLYRYYLRGQNKGQREQIIKAMKIIIAYAERAGVSKGEFLSSKIGGSNAKPPEALRPPFDG